MTPPSDRPETGRPAPLHHDIRHHDPSPRESPGNIQPHPNSPVHRGSPTPSDRRRSLRHRVHGPADFRLLHWLLRRGRILDLCLDGCLLQPLQRDTGYRPGDTLDLRFEVRRHSFRALATVRRLGPQGQLGVQITSLSPRSRRLLQQLLAELPPPSTL